MPPSSLSATLAGWKALQLELAGRRVVAPLDPLPRVVAGADVAFADAGQTAVAVVVAWDRETRQLLEVRSARRAVHVPYVPTYLSFREGDALKAAIDQLRTPFGVICFDGQGIAHPRRCGLATHLGVELDLPAVGFAKSLLVGTHAALPAASGASVPLTDPTSGDRLGVALRTRKGVRPIYVSEGHRIDLPSAVRLALACTGRYRIPEPTRLADRLVARAKLGETLALSDR